MAGEVAVDDGAQVAEPGQTPWQPLAAGAGGAREVQVLPAGPPVPQAAPQPEGAAQSQQQGPGEGRQKHQRVIRLSVALAVYVVLAGFIQYFLDICTAHHLLLPFQEVGQLNGFDLTVELATQSFPSTLLSIGLGLFVPLCGFFGSKQKHPCLLCTFACCNCLSIFTGLSVFIGTCAVIVGTVNLAPHAERWLQVCDPYQCMPQGNATNQTHLIDCLAAGVWPSTFRKKFPEDPSYPPRQYCPQAWLFCGPPPKFDEMEGPLPLWLQDHLHHEREYPQMSALQAQQSQHTESPMAGWHNLRREPKSPTSPRAPMSPRAQPWVQHQHLQRRLLAFAGDLGSDVMGAAWAPRADLGSDAMGAALAPRDVFAAWAPRAESWHLHQHMERRLSAFAEDVGSDVTGAAASAPWRPGAARLGAPESQDPSPPKQPQDVFASCRPSREGMDKFHLAREVVPGLVPKFEVLMTLKAILIIPAIMLSFTGCWWGKAAYSDASRQVDVELQPALDRPLGAAGAAAALDRPLMAQQPSAPIAH